MMYLAEESESPEWKCWADLSGSLSYLNDGQAGRVDISGVCRVAVDVPGEVSRGEGDRWEALSLDCVAYRVSEPEFSFQGREI